jgi:hypothetical protein
MARKKAVAKKKAILVDVAEIGRKGGLNSRKNFTDEEKKLLARKAAAARWDKKKLSSGSDRHEIQPSRRSAEKTKLAPASPKTSLRSPP